MATRTRSQSQTHMISLGYLSDTRHSPIRFTAPFQCWFTEIIKPNDPRENCPKIMETKYAKKRDLINTDSFRAVLRTELPDGANLITARYVLAINFDEKKRDIRQDMFPIDTRISWKTT